MTAHDHLNSALNRFLQSEEPGVLAVKGKWGVGKTYAWNKFVESYQAPAKQMAHSYVSLFGLRDLAEVRHAIVAKHKPFHKGAKSWLSQKGAEASKYMQHFGWGPVKNTQIFSDIIQERLLKNFVVCIDDLERKEDSITATSLLGFIASLREERHCKVVLLYNESELAKDQESADAIAEYREKVIDREVLFEPTPEECVDLIFGDKAEQYPKDGDILVSNNPLVYADDRGLRRIFVDMGVSNLRVLQKTKSALDYFRENTVANYPKLWPVLARQTAKLCCLYFQNGREYSLEELISGNPKAGQEKSKASDPLDHAHQLWNYRQRNGYWKMDTDVVVSDFLQNGYVEWDRYRTLLETADSKLNYNEIDSELHGIYETYGANFTVSHDSFITTLSDFIKIHSEELNLKDFNDSLKFLKEIDPEHDFSHLDAKLAERVDSFIARYPDRSFADEPEIEFGGSLAKRIRQRAAENAPQISIDQAFAKLAANTSWDPSDLRYMKETTFEDIFVWVSSSQNPDLLRQLKEFLRRFSGTPQGGQIAERFESALLRLGARSGLDEMRVYTFIGVPKKMPTDECEEAKTGGISAPPPTS